MIMLILSLALFGFIAYLILKFIPMPEIVKTVITVIVAVAMILYAMRALGIGDIPLPKLR